ncbi:hypothetical protein BOX15_Mlig007005g1, partial [Macrostomum lignano]
PVAANAAAAGGTSTATAASTSVPVQKSAPPTQRQDSNAVIHDARAVLELFLSRRCAAAAAAAATAAGAGKASAAATASGSSSSAATAATSTIEANLSETRSLDDFWEGLSVSISEPVSFALSTATVAATAPLGSVESLEDDSIEQTDSAGKYSPTPVADSGQLQQQTGTIDSTGYETETDTKRSLKIEFLNRQQSFLKRIKMPRFLRRRAFAGLAQQPLMQQHEAASKKASTSSSSKKWSLPHFQRTRHQSEPSAQTPPPSSLQLSKPVRRRNVIKEFQAVVQTSPGGAVNRLASSGSKADDSGAGVNSDDEKFERVVQLLDFVAHDLMGQLPPQPQPPPSDRPHHLLLNLLRWPLAASSD